MLSIHCVLDAGVLLGGRISLLVLVSTGTQLADVVMLVGTVDVVFGSVDM